MLFQELSVALILLAALALGSARSLDGYVKKKEIGAAYRIMYRSKPWHVAKMICEEDGGKLAVPKSEEEFQFIQKLVRAMHYPSISDTMEKLVVWLGISNIEDYRTWKSVDGDDINNFEFNKWAGENGQAVSNDSLEPHCAALDGINPGLRDWWCNLSQPFICELDLKSPTISN